MICSYSRQYFGPGVPDAGAEPELWVVEKVGGYPSRNPQEAALYLEVAALLQPPNDAAITAKVTNRLQAMLDEGRSGLR